MYSCLAYGLNLVSDIPLLTQEKESNNSSNYDVWIDTSTKLQLSQNSGGSNFLKCYLPNIADFIVQNGTHIFVDPFPGVSKDILRPCILGSAMSVLLQQRGFLVLHASCVVINGFAIAFLGNSGDGKSTLCSAFHALGYPMLTDDVMAIRFEGDRVTVVPSIPEIKLRSDSAKSLGYKKGTLSPLHPLSRKKIHTINRGFSDRSVPLKHIYLLAKGASNCIVPLSYQNSLVELIRHTRAVRTLKHQDLDRVHFQKCATILQKVSMSQLTRKFDLKELPNLIDLVRANLRQMNTVENNCDSQLSEATFHNL